MYRGGEDVFVQMDDSVGTTIPSVGHWKAHILGFFLIQNNGEYMIFFNAEYYNQYIEERNDHQHLLVDHVASMSVLETQRIPFGWDLIRPMNCTLHKFMALSLGNKLIAYETKDLLPRKKAA